MSDQRHTVTLSQAQESFVTSVLASRVPACHVLVALPGTGKGTAAVELIHRLSLVNPGTRALLLCPAALVHQFAARLTMTVESLKVEAVDRQRYRELDAAAPIDSSPFGSSTAVVLSIDLAKHADVARGLLATRWDILIIDEAHRLTGQRAQLVQQLIEARQVDRTLLMCATAPEGFIPSDAVVLSLPTDLSSLAGPRDQISIQRIAVNYTEPEQAVFATAEALADDLVQAGSEFVGNAIRAKTQSCFYALEQSLREMRNRAAHGSGPGTADDSAHEPPPSVIIEGAERVLAAMDNMEVDSKTEALCAFLSTRLEVPEGSSVVVLSRFRQTAEYLTSTLSNRGIRTRCLTGDMPSNEIRTVVEQLATPGVTVMTLASIQGFEFPPVATWVFYEKADDRGLHVALTRSRSASTGQRIEVFQVDGQ